MSPSTTRLLTLALALAPAILRAQQGPGPGPIAPAVIISTGDIEVSLPASLSSLRLPAHRPWPGPAGEGVVLHCFRVPGTGPASSLTLIEAEEGDILSAVLQGSQPPSARVCAPVSGPAAITYGSITLRLGMAEAPLTAALGPPAQVEHDTLVWSGEWNVEVAEAHPQWKLFVAARLRLAFANHRLRYAEVYRYEEAEKVPPN